MMGVNELLKEWLRDGDCYAGVIAAGKEVLGEELQDLARTAWHPVSDPPTEADSNQWGEVAVLKCDGTVSTENYWEADGYGEYWARINDVILLPPA